MGFTKGIVVMLEKISRVVLLKDFYGSLLTEKQQHVLNMYYEDDWSLSEIADSMDTSRQAIYDTVKRAENLLEQYENKMALVDRFQSMHSRLQDLVALLEQGQLDRELMKQARNVIKELNDLL